MILKEIKNLSNEWQKLLKPYLDNGGRKKLSRLSECLKNNNFHPCLSDAFKPLRCLKPENIKVVIVGQDPYPCREKATGIAFSYPKGMPACDSVENIFKAIKGDVGGKKPNDGNLDYLVKQGVFLINHVFTYQENSNYQEIKCCWKHFSEALIRAISKQPEKKKVFLLWGKEAQELKEVICGNGHCILTAPHPSPKNKNGINEFLACKHFSKANTCLCKNGRGKINWLPQ